MIATGSTYREKAETEARARIFWGDSCEEVLKHLVDHGIEHGEAGGMVEAYYHERIDTIRKMGMKKILIGLPCLAVPLAPWLVLTVIMHRLFMPPMMVICLPGSLGIYGAYSLIKGTQLYFLPDGELGDIAEKE